MRFSGLLAASFLAVTARPARASAGSSQPAGLVVVERGAARGPLRDLRRSEASLEALLRTPLPDWSPEAELVQTRVNTLLGGMIDYRRMAALSLGPAWNGLNEGERAALVERLAALTNRRLISSLRDTDAQLQFEAESVAGDLASVTATAVTIRTPDARRRLEYRLAHDTGRWLVYDVVVDGTGLVDGYRETFSRALRHGGFQAVLARLDHRLADPDGR